MKNSGKKTLNDKINERYGKISHEEQCKGTKRVIFSNVNFSSDTSNEVDVSPRAEEEAEVSHECHCSVDTKDQQCFPSQGVYPLYSECPMTAQNGHRHSLESTIHYSIFLYLNTHS